MPISFDQVNNMPTTEITRLLQMIIKSHPVVIAMDNKNIQLKEQDILEAPMGMPVIYIKPQQ